MPTTHRLPKGTPRFASTVRDVQHSSAIFRNQFSAERSAAASTVRDAVRREDQLVRAGTNPDELARVRSRITAYCQDYTGLDGLVSDLRNRFHLPQQHAAAATTA